VDEERAPADDGIEGERQQSIERAKRAQQEEYEERENENENGSGREGDGDE
jgi:hypothetical protein